MSLNDYIDEETVDRIIKYFLRTNRMKYALGTAICFYTGVRSNELLHIKVSDIDFEEKIIYINFAKLKRPRIVPYPVFLERFIKHYIYFFCLEKDHFLFFSQKNKKKTMANTMLNKYLTRASRDLKIKHVNPHMLRKSFGIMFIKRSGDRGLSILQRILGHSTPTTTLQYYQPFNMTDIKRQYKQYIEQPVINP